MKRRAIRIFSITMAGFLASFVMLLIIHAGIKLIEIIPFNVSPAAAFLYNIGVEGTGYALLLHFCYGILWSFVLVYTFEEDVSINKAVVLSVILWLFMMVVYSPLIGWGIFGFGYAHLLVPDHPLFLASGGFYLIIALLVHLIYGFVLGYLNASWLGNTEWPNR